MVGCAYASNNVKQMRLEEVLLLAGAVLCLLKLGTRFAALSPSLDTVDAQPR